MNRLRLVVALSFVCLFLVGYVGSFVSLDCGFVGSAIASDAVASSGGGGEHGDAHGGDAHHGHSLTHSQIMNFVWHILNFSILAFVLVKFLKKPISDALTGRQQGIRAQFEELEAKRVEAERMYADYEKKLSGMDAEAKRILQTFLEQGEAEKARIIAQAEESAKRIKAQAELYVQQELSKATAQLQKEVSDMAVAMAEEIVRKNITEEDQHRLIAEYLEKVAQKK